VKKAGGRAGKTAILLALLLPAYPADRLPAQSAQTLDTTSARAPSPAGAPAPRRIKPVSALWRSLLIPGWGQACTGRNFTGAAFAVWEGVAVMMTVRAVQEKHYIEETNSVNLASKRQQIQDWAVLWGFNHLFAGAEAFVSAHLLDFPKELKLRAVPHGIGVSFPLP
jgi:hypothetical protein